MTKDDIQDLLDAQAELYAEMLGEVEDRLIAAMELAFAEQTAAMVTTKNLNDTEKFINTIKEEICRRVYGGVRYQFDLLRSDHYGEEKNVRKGVDGGSGARRRDQAR